MSSNRLLWTLGVALLLYGCRPTSEPPSENLNQSPAGTNSSLPSLFRDPTGKIWMSWVEETDTIAALRYACQTDSGWSAPGTVARSHNWFLNWADYPMLASDGAGHLAAHVLEKSGEGKFAYSVRVFQSSDNGKTWPVDYLLNTDTVEGEHGFVSIKPTDKPGQWFMTWLDGRNTGGGEGHGHHGNMSLRAAIIAADGRRISEWEVDNKTCDCCQTAALWTSDGPITAYRDRSDEEVRDISVRRLENGTWSDLRRPGDDGWKINGCPVNGPRLAGSVDNVGLVWYTGANDSTQVKVALSDDGGKTFKPWQLVNTVHSSGRADIAEMPDHSFVVSWLEGNQILARRIPIQGKPGPVQIIAETTAGRSSGFPQLEAVGNQLVLAWTDTREERVKVRLFSLK